MFKALFSLLILIISGPSQTVDELNIGFETEPDFAYFEEVKTDEINKEDINFKIADTLRVEESLNEDPDSESDGCEFGCPQDQEKTDTFNTESSRFIGQVAQVAINNSDPLVTCNEDVESNCEPENPGPSHTPRPVPTPDIEPFPTPIIIIEPLPSFIPINPPCGCIEKPGISCPDISVCRDNI